MQGSTGSSMTPGRTVAVMLFAYALHFAWEMAHGSLFSPMHGMPFWQATAWCARAAGWDVAITAAAYLTAALASRRLDWIRISARWPYAIYFAAGLSVTIVIERWAVSAGRWTYRDAMPAIAGIGLTPLLQWVIIPALILVVLRRALRTAR